MKRVLLGRLGKKILLYFVTISFIPMVVIGTVGYIYIRIFIREQVFSTLSATAKSMRENLSILIEEKKNRTRNLAADPDGYIRDSLEKIYTGTEESEKTSKDLSNYLDISSYPILSSCFERFILDVQGKVVASSNRRLLGKNMQSRDFFIKAIKLPYGGAYISDVYDAEPEDIQQRYSYYVSSPVISTLPKGVAAVVVNRFDLSEVAETLKGKWLGTLGAGTQFSDAGKTGEVYIVNEDRLMLSSSRAEEYATFATLSQLVDTEPVKKALLRKEGVGAIYKNYKGLTVLGVSKFIKETKWTMLTERELKDAYALLTTPRNIMVIIALATISAITLIGLFITRTLIQPIMLLREGADLVGKGNLSHKLLIKTNDEIQDVAEAFNDMTSEIKEIYDNLQMSIYESRKHATELAAESKKLERVNTTLRSDRTAMMNIMEDMNEANRQLKDIQAQLLQSEKMAVVGQLAAGVAHEINNPMSFILSNLDTLSKYMPDIIDAVQNKQSNVDAQELIEDVVKMVQESYEGALRVKRIVQDLRTFSHVDEAELQSVDIHTCLDSTLNILENEIKYKVEIIKEYGNIPNIRCYPMQLSQIFLNLIVNALQAIENQGKISIKTYSAGGKIFIEIGDTGCGIPPEVIDRIFEPFFTTKRVGKGTGLGLSIVYNIIKRHNGEISVKSKIGEGSLFTIALPISGFKPKLQGGI